MSKTSRSPEKTVYTQFFQHNDVMLEQTRSLVKDSLKDADFGELYQEMSSKEVLVKDKGEFVVVSLGNNSSGFGVRFGQGNTVGYSYSDLFNKQTLKQSIEKAKKNQVAAKSSKKDTDQKPQNEKRFYPAENPADAMTVEQKITKINEIEDYVRTLGDDIENVTIQYQGSSKLIHIINEKGESLYDLRPSCTLTINVTIKGADGKIEVGSDMMGGPITLAQLFSETEYKRAADNAYQQAQELLRSDEAPAGKMDVILGNGWSAVLLHEAIGHGLEGDFNRRGISVYSGKVGQKVATDKVTVIDQGDMNGERGSVQFDDEGLPSQKNVLIKDGVLKGYMQDRQNAKMMKAKTTGNGRREDFTHLPMPRMTNTYFAAGDESPEDIIKGVKLGLYITDMGGGAVDITSGEFNMNATVAYMVRDGKICEPVKGASIIGDGLTVIQNIMKVGNDLKLERTRGVCGKNGQRVIVGCGQPTVLVKGMKVGGTKKVKGPSK